MAVSKEWQLQYDAAKRYEEVLVSSILGPFARLVVERSELQVGESVLDVGCGTGAATRYAAQKVGSAVRVTGLDMNPGMIEVAKSLPPVDGATIDWVEKGACELPLSDDTFDVVLCSQVLQFLTERSKALSEMCRVLKPGGRVCLSHWCDIRENPYFHALLEAVSELLGNETGAGLKAAFVLSDPEVLRSLLRDAGFRDLVVTVVRLELQIPVLEEFVPRHLDATPLGPAYRATSSQNQLAVVRHMARRLSEFEPTEAPGLRIPFSSLLAVARK